MCILAWKELLKIKILTWHAPCKTGFVVRPTCILVDLDRPLGSMGLITIRPNYCVKLFYPYFIMFQLLTFHILII